MSHIILFGDSIFDNGVYVADQPDVIQQLRSRLPQQIKATLRAVDGSTTNDVYRQLEQLPSDATHAIISVGGNDALRAAGILSERVNSVAEALDKLADIGKQFSHDYHRMLQAVLRHQIATAVCTIYDPCFVDPTEQRVTVTALTIFNDCIMREAFNAGIPLLDLRLICNSHADYANSIEPSATGGVKIADAINRIVTQHTFEQRQTIVFT